jgi:hypothetical protein
VISTVPVPAGEVAVIEVDAALIHAAAVDPNFTEVMFVKFVPVIVTAVPPPAGPELGEIEVTVGAATYVN